MDMHPTARALVLVLVTMLGCGAPPAPAGPSAPAQPAAPLPPLDLPAAALPPHGTLLLGDLHGTRELPAFVGRVVTAAAAREPVVLALEMATSESPAIQAFLGSDGGIPARRALIAGAWWQSPYQDGRRSDAMAELIDVARRLRAAGRAIEVVAIDAAPESGQEGREEAMAQAVIAARRAHPDAALIVFAGNLHTSINERPRQPGFAWMAMRVARAGIELISLDPRLPEGTHWGCYDGVPEHCGVAYVGGAAAAPGIELRAGTHDHGTYAVASATASPPAARPVSDLDARIAAAARSPQALRGRALREYTAKRYGACADMLSQIENPDAGIAYDHACCLALAGRKDDAYARLRYAIGAGFADFDHLEADPDLASLRGDPRWPVKR